MLEIERIPLRAEAEKLLEVGAYLAHRLRRAGIETADFDLPGFGRVITEVLPQTGKITLSFAEEL